MAAAAPQPASGQGGRRAAAIAAVVIAQLAFGGVYAWSTFVPGLHAEAGLDLVHTQAVFGAVFAVFVATMLAVRRLLERWPPAAVLAAAALCYGAGHALAWLGQGAFLPLLAGIGLLAAIGIGLGYGTALQVVNAWLPGRPGLATAIAVTGFGGGSIVQALLGEGLLAQGLTALSALGSIGLGAAALVAAVAALVRRPPATTGATIAPAAALDPAPWWPLWLAMGCATGGGLLLIGMLKPLMLEAGAASLTVHAGVTVLAAGNLGGRLVWGLACDRWRQRAGVTALLFLALSALLLPAAFAAPPALALGTVALFGMSFGACFVLFASLTAQRWGPAGIARVYPRVFTGYGLAGLVIPPAAGWLMDRLHSPLLAGELAALLAAVAALATALWSQRQFSRAAAR